MRSVPLPTNQCSFISTYELGSCVEAQCAVCCYINKRHMNLCTFKKTSRYSYPHTNRGVTGYCASTYEPGSYVDMNEHRFVGSGTLRIVPLHTNRGVTAYCASTYELRASTCEEVHMWRHCASRYEPRALVLICASRYEHI